jgi:hypothetical protein
MNRTIAALSRRMLEKGQLFERYLPHHVAVCITKFDHPAVVQQARRRGLVAPGPNGIPQVPDARALFRMICDGTFWAERHETSTASASFVRYELERYFHPKRIHYFVTSAIGFYLTPNREPGQQGQPRFDPEDFANFHATVEGERIRGAITPINVLEPLLTVRDGISSMTRTRWLRAVPPDGAEERRRTSARPLPWTA